jgi:riboflavin synthase
MFTGIIRAMGTVAHVTTGDRDTRFVINAPEFMSQNRFDRGASIAHNGVCLTLVEQGPDWFAVEVSGETLSKTTMGSWRPGRRINLEASLKLGDELGGHLVSGHIDGTTTIVSITRDGGSHRIRLAIPPTHAGFIAPKGSIALDGISLTVNDVQSRPLGLTQGPMDPRVKPEGLEDSFGINIIPYTWDHTNFASLAVGDAMNFEVDVMARYAARLMRHPPV